MYTCKSHYDPISDEEDGPTQNVENEEGSRAALQFSRVAASKQTPMTWREKKRHVIFISLEQCAYKHTHVCITVAAVHSRSLERACTEQTGTFAGARHKSFMVHQSEHCHWHRELPRQTRRNKLSLAKLRVNNSLADSHLHLAIGKVQRRLSYLVFFDSSKTLTKSRRERK